MFVFDNNDESIFERTVDFAIRSKMDCADFNILCPYPGTKVYDRLRREDRIIEADWSKYFGSNVVFRLKKCQWKPYTLDVFEQRNSFITLIRLSEDSCQNKISHPGLIQQPISYRIWEPKKRSQILGKFFM
jgi:hypothetical protein